MREWLLLPFLLLTHPGLSQGELVLPENNSIPENLEISSLDLNKTDAATLRLLSSLSDQQISDIINYRNTLGPFLAPMELQVISSLSLNEIKSLLTQFYIRENSAGQPFSSSRGHILYRYKITPSSNSAKGHAGSFHYMMFRLQYRLNEKIRGAVTMEKDAGEKLLWNPGNGYYGPDHLAGYILWQPSGTTHLIAGNFLVHYGQGLVSGAGFNLGKGRNPIESLVSPTSGIIGYRGLQESLGGIGAAVHVTKPKINMAWYAQRKKLDAVLHTNFGKPHFQTIQTSGQHRTDSEIHNRHAVSRKTVGAFIESNHLDFITLGAYVKYDLLSHPLRPDNSIHNLYKWSGSDLLTTSFLMRIRYRQIVGWSEYAVNYGGKSASQTGVLISLGRRWSSSLVLRDYKPGYFSFDSNAFGERSAGPENERGIFLGLSFRPRKKWTITSYLDTYNFPWLTYTASAPGTGIEYFISSQRQLKNGLQITLDYRIEEKPENFRDDLASLQQVKVAINRQVGIYLSKRMNPQVEMRFRYRWKQVKQGPTTVTGSAAYQEIILSLRRWDISYRFTLFDSENYLSRIYFYERDIWGSFTLPAYFGKGISQYLLIRFRMSRWCDLWVRAGISRGMKARANNGVYSMREEKKLVSCQVRINL